jgi:hypothetical protein
MGPIKFNVTFLMGPPNCTCTQTTFAPKKKLTILYMFSHENLLVFIVLETKAIGMKKLKSKDL